MIDLIAEIAVVLAFVISLFVVPGWASGLLLSKSTKKPAPSSHPYAAESPNGEWPRPSTPQDEYDIVRDDEGPVSGR